MCSKNEYTKSESNSQLLTKTSRKLYIVFKERIYKIWKQFTTAVLRFLAVSDCVQRTNIQNLKAIHNRFLLRFRVRRIVFKERIYKIWKQFTTLFCFSKMAVVLCSKNEYTKSESNSQRYEKDKQIFWNCVQRTNIQNLKAIHNMCSSPIRKSAIVFKERIYKIWKQFTTLGSSVSTITGLCSKNEYTKSESNSQPSRVRFAKLCDCVQRTNIQNLKAIHNRSHQLLL